MPEQSNINNGPSVKPPQTQSDRFDMDLYAQITAEDDPQDIPKVKKKSQSPFMLMVVVFMKLTFWLDDLHRSHETFFRFLGGLWAGVMSLLYLSGIIAFVLSIFSWMRLPLYLQDYFEKHNLQYDSLKMADFSLSKINVTNLRDINNTYSVPTVHIQSTFADFLKNKVRVIEADGLQINFTTDGPVDTEQFDSLIKMLRAFTDPKGSGLDVTINSVKIDHSVLNLNINNTKVPVAFSLSGIYTNESQIVVPFFVNENFLRLDASLSVQGQPDQREFNLHINSGNLTLPDRPPEELSGELNWVSNNGQMDKLSADLTFNYGYSLKKVKWMMNKGADGFDGQMIFTYMNTANQGVADKALADLTIEFQGLKWPKLDELTTTQPLNISVRRFAQDTTVIEGMDAILNGGLSCNLSKRFCAYSIQKETNVKLQNLLFNYKDQAVVLNDINPFRLLPSTNSIVFSMQDPAIQLNLNMAAIQMAGNLNSSNKMIQMDAQTTRISGAFSQKPLQTHLLVNVTNGNYQTQNISMKQVDLNANDIFDETAPVQFKAGTIQTPSALMQKPVSVDMTFLDRQASMQIKVKDTDIVFLLDGVFKPFQGTFSGQFNMPVVKLENLPFALSEISQIFPSNLKNISGQMSASGQIHFYGASNIAGPLFVGFKDINFDIDETQIQGLNGVLGLQSVLPLVSAQNQSLSIQNIQSVVPVSNVKIDFQLANQAMRLSGVNATVANQPVTMSGSLIPFRKPSALLYLKTSDNFDMTAVAPYMNLQSISVIGGTGSLSIPVELSEGKISMPSLTMKMNNVTLQQKNGQDMLGLFQQGNSGYMVRNGQFVLSGSDLQVDVDGWLLPKRQKDSLDKKVALKQPLFKPSKLKPLSKEILERQKYLFKDEKASNE